jgi:hypothetical protein
MLPNKDRVSQPSKGRFFALTAGQLLGAVKARSFKHSEYKKRIDIEFRNPTSESDLGQQLAAFYPSDGLILYSFPDEFGAARAKALTETVLDEFQRIDATSTASYSRKESTSFRIYLGMNNQLKVTRRVQLATLTKYRGDAKFSNAFKPKKVETSEEIIHSIDVGK